MDVNSAEFQLEGQKGVHNFRKCVCSVIETFVNLKKGQTKRKIKKGRPKAVKIHTLNRVSCPDQGGPEHFLSAPALCT